MSSEEFDGLEITPYDEFPVHQTPYPVSYVPASDPAFDSGYYFGVYNVEDGLFLVTGLRINPNSDMIGAHASINVRGVQRTLRISREWRANYALEVGPLRYDFIEPLKKIRLTLGKNESGMEFDVTWDATGPVHLSSHHRAVTRTRRTTDQTRYNQVGQPTGWLSVDGKRYEITPANWGACRDRSWGLYEPRPPFAMPAKFLPPTKKAGLRRALRFSCFFETARFSGHFHFHEGENGEQHGLNDPFGTPFEGRLDYGFDSSVKLVSAEHKLKFRPNTRSMTSGELTLKDEAGREWGLSIEVPHPPHVLGQVGYHIGAWTDGGTIHTYHGPGVVQEWDEFDFRIQPCDHTLPGTGETRKVFGVEHVARLRFTTPDGEVIEGKSQIEIFLNGKYSPYGFEATNEAGGLAGRGTL